MPRVCSVPVIAVLVLLVQYCQMLTNPIHLARRPISAINALIRLHVFTIKIQRQAHLGVFKSAGSEPTALHFTNTKMNTTNPFQRWVNTVIDQGRSMTKEQFAAAGDFGYKAVFKNFRFMKDNYDSYKTLPTPSTAISRTEVQLPSPVAPRVSIQQINDLVVLPLSLADLGQIDLGDLCQALARAWVAVGSHLCVYELEIADEATVLSQSEDLRKRFISEERDLAKVPAFDPKQPGNYVAVTMPDGGILGVHVDRPEETPQAVKSYEPLQQYISSAHKSLADRVNQILQVYDQHITFAFGDVREEIWLSDNQRVVEDLNDLDFWGTKLEYDLSLLDLDEIERHTLPNLKKAFAKIHDHYSVNYVSHSKKIENFERKPLVLRLLLKYPICTILTVLTGYSLAKFYINERKDIRKVFTKSYNI